MTAEYIQMLTEKYPEIEAVWQFGSRANNRATSDSDWDYLVFGDSNLFEKLRADTNLNDPNVDLFVVYDGDSFQEPWTDEGLEPKTGSLSAWEWRVNQDDERTAMYDDRGEIVDGGFGRKGQRDLAIMVWPPADEL